MQIVKGCNRLGTSEHSAAHHVQAVGQGLAEALTSMQAIPKGLQQQGPGPCNGCGKQGHIKRD